ncbi:MAG: hypothetical protein ACRD2B_06250 [Terriglobia bacterium]
MSVSLLLLWGATVSGMAHSAPRTVTLNGYVIDSACWFTKNLKKPVSPACAVACAKAGSPLVILAADGTIYWPISNRTPAKSQNALLMPFAGKRVMVTGKIYEKGGSHAIVITGIQVVGPVMGTSETGQASRPLPVASLTRERTRP